jgi:hypothetical protein
MEIEMSSTLVDSHKYDGLFTGVPTLRMKLAKAKRHK